MAYNDGEALILARIRAHANYDANNTARENWKLLDSGASDYYAILRPDAFETEWVAPSKYRAHWVTAVEVWQRYDLDATTPQSLATRRSEIIEQLMTSKRLGDTTNTINDATVTRGEVVEEMWTARGGPAWMRATIYVRWTEEESVAFS